MALHAFRTLALATVLVLAGCAGSLPGSHPSTPADVEPRIVNATTTGGQCVETPMHGFDVTSAADSGVLTVSVAGNATVPGAHYVIDELALARTGSTAFRLDIETTMDTDKPARECPDGGIARFELTLELPATDPFALEIRQDGEPVATLGSGSEP